MQILIFCHCFFVNSNFFFCLLFTFFFISLSFTLYIHVFGLTQPSCSPSFRVRVCSSVCLITASVAVTALGYKHHQSRRDVTLFIARVFVRLLKRLHRASQIK